ncbi:MAG: dephospho-CoA kinase [bacterium]
MNDLVRIGIVGGICTGKSTVAGEFAKAGIPVISGDEMGHITLEDNIVIERIKSKISNNIIKDGSIDRSLLADIVFSDWYKLKILNEILLPHINVGISKKEREFKSQGAKTVVLDAALIYEWEIECLYDIIIMTIAPYERRLKWIQMRFNIDEKRAMKRLEFHREIEARILNSKRLPDYIISNDGDLPLLKERANSIVKEVKLLSELYSKGFVKDFGGAQNKRLQRKVRKNPRA